MEPLLKVENIKKRMVNQALPIQRWKIYLLTFMKGSL